MAPPVGSRTVFLVGFMCCGKTTVGRRLAERRGGSFIDTDERIARHTGRTIEAILAGPGEEELRRLEIDCLRSLPQAGATVVGTGGGAYSRYEVRRSLACRGLTVWLDVSLGEARGRRKADATPRPLWSDSDDAVAFRAFFERRRAVYAMAEARVDADRAPDEVVRAVERLLDEPESHFFH
ncbi:MAG TPA: shikimate kinase [Candidatus Polarisedimenticolaceae bacterium]|nr:shikimate kinase [Candidatus Polarisedimenticolaceae bacterium]